MVTRVMYTLRTNFRVKRSKLKVTRRHETQATTCAATNCHTIFKLGRDVLTRKYSSPSNDYTIKVTKSHNAQIHKKLRHRGEHSASDFGTNPKLICDFPLVINTNLPPILHPFQAMADYW